MTLLSSLPVAVTLSSDSGPVVHTALSQVCVITGH